MTTVCDLPNVFDEGVEVAVGNWNYDGRWIPLAFYAPNFNRSNFSINMGDDVLNDTLNIVTIRGYEVPVNTSGTFSVSLNVCDRDLFTRDDVQFRWLQTAYFNNDDNVKDVWTLDNVKITLHLSVNDTNGTVLFKDDFNNQDTVK